MTAFTESTVEGAALALPKANGWMTAYRPEIAPDMPAAERTGFSDVVLVQRLRDAAARVNPDLPDEALGDVFRKLTRPAGAEVSERNRPVRATRKCGAAVSDPVMVSSYGRGQG